LVNARLDLMNKRHLYLLFKEMINNVVKHAHARNCMIQLQYQHNRLLMIVADDGCGFNSTKPKTTRSGLSNMGERARKLSGTLHIYSEEGKGCRLEVSVPA
jgi:two-component system nitrate/nitrite sensor histidine kinase NarX